MVSLFTPVKLLLLGMGMPITKATSWKYFVKKTKLNILEHLSENVLLVSKFTKRIPRQIFSGKFPKFPGLFSRYFLTAAFLIK